MGKETPMSLTGLLDAIKCFAICSFIGFAIYLIGEFIDYLERKYKNDKMDKHNR